MNDLNDQLDSLKELQDIKAKKKAESDKQIENLKAEIDKMKA